MMLLETFKQHFFKGCRQIFEAYKLTFAYALISTNFTIQVSLRVDGLFLFRVSDPILIGYMIYGYTVTIPRIS